MTYSPAPGLYVRYDYTNAIPFHSKTIPGGSIITEAGRTVIQAKTQSVSDPTGVDPARADRRRSWLHQDVNGGEKGSQFGGEVVPTRRRSRMSLSLFPRWCSFRMARSCQGARRCWARRSEHLTARTVLRPSKDRKGERTFGKGWSRQNGSLADRP
jgi:hypothetical protein